MANETMTLKADERPVSLEKKELKKKDLIKSWLLWITFGQACYNFERMQGLGFCCSMKPIIDRLYKNDKAARSDAMKRHLTYYNTENNWGAIIAGVAASMEEDKANGADIPDEAINGMKTALMGPMAGIGDTVTQSLVKTILLGIGCSLALSGNAFGPVLFLLGMSVYTLLLSHRAYFLGYKYGKKSVTRILGSGIIREVTDSLGALGIMVLGAMVSANINITTPFKLDIGGSVVEFQSIFDSILPKMLPLALFFITYKLVNKGKKPILIIGILFLVGLVGSILGILG